MANKTTPIFELTEIIILIKNNLTLLIITSMLGLVSSTIYWMTSPPTYLVTAAIQIDNADTNANYDSTNNIINNNQPIFTNNAPVSDKSIVYLSLPYILDPVINSLHLDIEVQPKLFPIWGKYLYYTHIRLGESGLAKPFLTGKGYSWGGEIINISNLVVPKNMVEKPYILKVINNDKYIITYRNSIVLVGYKNKIATTSDGSFQIYVDQIIANPGTIFIVKKRDLTNVEQSLSQRIQIKEIMKAKKDATTTTGIIGVSLTGSNKLMTKEIVAELINTLVEKSAASKLAKINAILKFINAELPDAKLKLSETQNLLATFKQKNHLTVLDDQQKFLLGNIADLDKEITTNKVTLSALQNEYGPKHPVIKSLIAQQEDLLHRKQELINQSTKFPAEEVELIRLRANLDLNQQLVATLESKRQELLLLASGQISSVSVLDAPDAPVLPQSSHGKLIVLVGSVLGFIFGIFIILFTWLIRKNPDPFFLEKEHGVPVYTIIRYAKLKNYNKISSLNQQKSLLVAKFSQAFLDFNVLSAELLINKNSSKIFQFFATSAHQGTTFVVFNCAYVLSLQQQKVLFITVGTTDNLFFSNKGRNSQLQTNENLLTVKLEYNNNAHEIQNHIEHLISLSDGYDFILIDLTDIYADSLLANCLAFSDNRFMITSPSQGKIFINRSIRLLELNGLRPKGVIFNYTHKYLIHDFYSKAPS